MIRLLLSEFPLVLITRCLGMFRLNDSPDGDWMLSTHNGEVQQKSFRHRKRSTSALRYSTINKPGKIDWVRSGRQRVELETRALLTLTKHGFGWRPSIGGSTSYRFVLFRIICIVALPVAPVYASVRLDALGNYLTAHGYGGAQLVRLGNYYHLPIYSNGRPGNLVIDTGAPATLIFRSSVKRLGLRESKTKDRVRGAFGKSRQFYGVATIKALTAGNCRFTSVPVAIAPDLGHASAYGSPSGFLGLREMIRFGAILDIPHRIIYLSPSRPSGEVDAAIRAMLVQRGWTPVALSMWRGHLRVSGQIDDTRCNLVVDTGAYLTTLDREIASRAKLGRQRTPITAEGIGNSSGNLILATFSSLWIGNYQIKKGSAIVADMDPDALGRGTKFPVDGFLGIEHLAMNSAIFDFVSGTLYLRPASR
jgi:predicted aspartyl protease